jgi:hypothetical protein
MPKIKYLVGSKLKNEYGFERIILELSKSDVLCVLSGGEHIVDGQTRGYYCTAWYTPEELDKNGYTLVSSPRWIPKIGDTYFTIYNDGSYGDWCWTGDKVDLFRLKTDNVKRTREECQKKIDEINSRDI